MAAVSSRPASARSYKVGVAATEPGSEPMGSNLNLNEEIFRTSNSHSPRPSPKARSNPRAATSAARPTSGRRPASGTRPSSASRPRSARSATTQRAVGSRHHQPRQQQHAKGQQRSRPKTANKRPSSSAQQRSYNGFLMGGARRPATATRSAHKKRPRSSSGARARGAPPRPPSSRAAPPPPADPQPSTSSAPSVPALNLSDLDDSYPPSRRPSSQQGLIRPGSRSNTYSASHKPAKKSEPAVPKYMLPGICLALLGLLFMISGVMMISITSTAGDKVSNGSKAAGPILLLIGVGLTGGGLLYKVIKHRKHKKKLLAEKKQKAEARAISTISLRAGSPNFTDEVTLGIEDETAKRHKLVLSGKGFTNRALDSNSTASHSPRLPLKNMFLASSFIDKLPEDSGSLSSNSSISLPAAFNDEGEVVLPEETTAVAPTTESASLSAQNAQRGDNKENTHSAVLNTDEAASNEEQCEDTKQTNNDSDMSSNHTPNSKLTNGDCHNAPENSAGQHNLEVISEHQQLSNGSLSGRPLRMSSSTSSMASTAGNHVSVDNTDDSVTLSVVRNESSGDLEGDITTLDAHIIIERRMSYQI